MEPREKLLRILMSIRSRIVSPSDVITNTGLPRYEVLAAFHMLEALGLIELVYTRGNYKLYRLTKDGEKVLEALSSGKKLIIGIEGYDEAQRKGIDASEVREKVEAAVEA